MQITEISVGIFLNLYIIIIMRRFVISTITVRGHPHYNNVKLVAYTANTFKTTIINCIDKYKLLHMFHINHKPYITNELLIY